MLPIHSCAFRYMQTDDNVKKRTTQQYQSGLNITAFGMVTSFFAGAMVGVGRSLIDERSDDDQDVTDAIVSRRTVRSALGYGTLWMGIYVTVPSFVRQFWLLQ